jgi:hypothetical protein
MVCIEPEVRAYWVMPLQSAWGSRRRPVIAEVSREDRLSEALVLMPATRWMPTNNKRHRKLRWSSYRARIIHPYQRFTRP